MDRSALSFGERLLIAREAAGLTQQQLADLLKVDQVQVSKWERGGTRPRFERLEAMTAVLGDWVVTGRGQPPRKRSKTGLPIEEGGERPLGSTQQQRKRKGARG